jgi:hypothetical protein
LPIYRRYIIYYNEPPNYLIIAENSLGSPGIIGQKTAALPAHLRAVSLYGFFFFSFLLFCFLQRAKTQNKEQQNDF